MFIVNSVFSAFIFLSGNTLVKDIMLYENIITFSLHVVDLSRCAFFSLHCSREGDVDNM